ncbi:MAG: AbrB/MazE/SpoVT family DNA-binding domain-containing protein [Alphaproteobacteria bacterium]
MRAAKLTRIGNSTGLTLPREVLAAAELNRGDAVAVSVHDGVIEIRKAEDGYDEAMEVGHAFIGRYRRTMAALAK